jgi:electron transfer flavoprotein alpha subunit
MTNEIWVYLETERGAIRKGSLEILSRAGKTAAAGGYTLTALVFSAGGEPPPDISEVKNRAQKIYLVSMATPHYNTERRIDQVNAMIKEYRPAMLFLAATPLSREMAPRLAARLDAPLISGCTDFKLEKDDFTGFRPMMRGKAQAAVVCRASSFFIATLCTGVFDIERPTGGDDCEIITLSPAFTRTQKVEFLQFIKGDPASISIKEADAVIAIGRGLEDAGRLPMVEELAGLLDASIGGTRTAVDLRWLALERQIGITGETVSPRLFISCGISGQYPHTVGMDNSETIIVINKDRDAPIFKLASLGIVGAMEDIIPALSRHIRNAAGKDGPGK